MQDYLINLTDVTKTYTTAGSAVNALRGVSLNVLAGESIAIMGQSGSGKSTLLSVIGGLNPPTKGSVHIDGIDLYALSSERRADFRREYLGFVFQQFQLIPYLTALENVLLPLTTTGYPGRQKHEMAMEALNQVNMAQKTKRLPSELSGGEQERVAIARAIVNEPPLILADEPTGSLDSKTAGEIMELFTSLNEDGLTILMVTHNPENSGYMKRTVVIQDGLLPEDSNRTITLAEQKISVACGRTGELL